MIKNASSRPDLHLIIPFIVKYYTSVNYVLQALEMQGILKNFWRSLTAISAFKNPLP